MLFHEIRVSGLLSFPPEGLDLPLRDLNVFIGPNGSGKTNLLEILSLFQSAPTHIARPIRESGGIREWLWKSRLSEGKASIEVVVDNPNGKMPIRHTIRMRENADRIEIADECIANRDPYSNKEKPYFFYDFQNGVPVINRFGEKRRELRRETVKPDQSVLSQFRDPERYPELGWLQHAYEKIAVFRNWSFGPRSGIRAGEDPDGPSDFLRDGGNNLALVLSELRSRIKPELLENLQHAYEGIQDLRIGLSGGKVVLYLEETGGKEIPASRLSDGTLRYLCLLSILLHPEPPPLIAIEEPELGLHPDLLPEVARLLKVASTRSQLIVTTHSEVIIDALHDSPESVVVCEKGEKGTRMRRLNADELSDWLEEYRLGELWSKGQIGGNRW